MTVLFCFVSPFFSRIPASTKRGPALLSSSHSYTMLSENGKLDSSKGDVPNKESTSNRSFPQEIDMVAGVRHNPREEREKGMMRRLSQSDLREHASKPKPTIDQIYSSIVQSKSESKPESKIDEHANEESDEDHEESMNTADVGVTRTKSLKPVPESSTSSLSFSTLDLDDDDDDTSNKDSSSQEEQQTNSEFQEISSQYSTKPNNSNGKMFNATYLDHRHIWNQDPSFKISCFLFLFS